MSEPKPNLEPLVARAQAGDAEAIGELYDLLAPDMYRYAITIVHCEDKAEDIVSEAFLRGWTHLSSFKGGNFKAFLYTIARNYAYDVLRKEKKVTWLEEEPEDKSKHNDVQRCAIMSEEAQQLLSALKKLPPKPREIVTLRFLEGMSVKETAQIMRVSQISVRVTQSRALRKLEDLLS